MTLALVGGALLRVGDGLATGCCCDEEENDGGYWWCLYGNCIQSELAPDGPWVARHLTLEACQRQCLDNFDCGCCASPNPLTGQCEECDEACTQPSGESCDDSECEALSTGSQDDCACEKYPPCSTGFECGCCMQCAYDDLTDTGRCVPCPDGTVCNDPGDGRLCSCVPFEVCERFPILCPTPPPSGFGYSCTRNECGDGDCRRVRGGTYPNRWTCERACQEEVSANCGLAPVASQLGGLGGVSWIDTIYTVQSAKADICIKHKARGVGLYRLLIKAPQLRRDCTVEVASVVVRDSSWRCVTDECQECQDCDHKNSPSEQCKTIDPARPYCVNGTCGFEPTKCKRCRTSRKGQCGDGKREAQLKWTKPKGVTTFAVREMYDAECGRPEVCFNVECPDCVPLPQGACEDERGQCCIPPEVENGIWTCAVLLDCECRERGGIFSRSPAPCQPEGVCCIHNTCEPDGPCPSPCCCPEGGGACGLPPPNEPCREPPPCCSVAGCLPSVVPSVCRGFGGVPMLGAEECTPGLCCPIRGANDCGAGAQCCGEFRPPDVYAYQCCEAEKCCKAGKCLPDEPTTCPACQSLVGPKCARECKTCDELGQICCNNACVNGPCCPGQIACGNDCCPAGQICCDGVCANGPCCPGETPCGNGCCPAGRSCCNGTCCPSGQCCCNNQCVACCTATSCGSGRVCDNGCCRTEGIGDGAYCVVCENGGCSPSTGADGGCIGAFGIVPPCSGTLTTNCYYTNDFDCLNNCF